MAPQQGGGFGVVLSEHGTEQVIVGFGDLARHTLFYGTWFASASNRARFH